LKGHLVSFEGKDKGLLKKYQEDKAARSVPSYAKEKKGYEKKPRRFE